MRNAFIVMALAACGDSATRPDALVDWSDATPDPEDAPDAPDAPPDAPPPHDAPCATPVTALGDCRGAIVPVTPPSSETPNAEVVWTGTDYALAWIARDAQDARRVYLGRLDTTGTALSSVAISEGTTDVYNPVIAWSGSELAIAWCDSSNDVYFLRATAAGAPIGSPQQVSEAAANAQGVQMAWNGARYGLAWHDQRAGNSEIYFASLDATGTKQTADVRVTTSAARSWTPHLAPTATGFAIAWTEDASTFVNSVGVVRVDNAGAGVGVTVTDVSSWIGDARLLDRTGTLAIVWDDNRATDRDIYFTRVDANGAEPASDVRLTTTAAFSDQPFLAWNGTRYRLAWQESGVGLSLADLDTTGVKSTADTMLVATPLSPARPRLVWTGDHYGVFWQSIGATSDERRLYFTTLTPQ